MMNYCLFIINIISCFIKFDNLVIINIMDIYLNYIYIFVYKKKSIHLIFVSLFLTNKKTNINNRLDKYYKLFFSLHFFCL